MAGWWGNVVERFMFNIGCNVGFFFDNKEVARRSDIILSPLVVCRWVILIPPDLLIKLFKQAQPDREREI